jgi:1,4-alpha-glucan branching enzyme
MKSSTTVERKKKVSFTLEAGECRDVFVAGSFNNWDPQATPMMPVGGDGLYKASLTLPKGSYEYKFVVDGNWQADPGNPNSVANGAGSQNSVMNV